ncbi:Lrp/AsnC family transcriptional regulator [Vogesella sp. LIG4]|uniref:siroheme decarboxylase subunit beta n=1 Tax=Vogesella sp. LIG4 TaxID=1192162 RepID=UPI0008200735|nr:Lrp/AsnC family transcriptional regulator [Vogesella sp. LIG4]SCK19361.1 DNA-binding transcriptional regulator, Lrp family [Vogesella sp. LIG4]
MNAALPLDVIDSLIIDRLQGGFPLLPGPFALAGEPLGLSAAKLCERLQSLLDRKVLTRFGPMYQVERMGGAFVLAAMVVPEARYDAVAAQLDALPAVAHNYRREHELNMWFVLATSTPGRIYDAMLEIEEATGLRVYDFPKLREYYVGMQFAVGGSAPVGRRELVAGDAGAVALDDTDWQLIRRTQGGLPLLAEPWQQLGAELGLAADEVCTRLAAMVQNGVIRRIGAVPNHYAIGYAANGMAVFDVDDEQVDALGQQVGAQPFVSHCYRRLRRQPVWPYNLFAMCHGRSRDEVQDQVAAIRQQLGDACRRHEVLFSSRILKKSGLRV